MTESEDIDRRRWVDLVREDETAASTQFAYAYEWLQITQYVLNGNFDELTAIPEQFSADPRLLGVAARPAQQALLLDFVRRLHNYVAAVKTLVDHTRAFRLRNVPEEPLAKEYEQRVAALREKPVVCFLQEFRNPVMHSQLPRVSLTTTVREGVLRQQLTIKVADALAMHEWSGQAKRYIDEAREGYYTDKQYLDLVTAARLYQAEIGLFYEWFHLSVENIRRDILCEYRERRRLLAELQLKLMARNDVQGAS